ncbi:type III secretion system chaperone [Robbsia sp. Bb-Pol-6]|uniref:Type III secretion system chaperone n=1 Tax=Robbsia betulipollinis TaxID=2981849 RepID=A0ABT3ZMT9_9BURK|nr:type III secretion system chaperone [Robbsia betulipollinis]MCY0387260.1 type III secretion system chaperone [Robbsia betulipollinis]
MRYVDLLAALGLASRLDLAAAAHAGACTLVFHETFELTISAAPDARQVRLHAPLIALGASGERDRARVLGNLLQIAVPRATRHCAHFGFDPLLDRIILFKTIDLAADGAAAQAVLAVESFLRQGIELLHTLPSLLHPAPDAAARHMALPSTSTFV